MATSIIDPIAQASLAKTRATNTREGLGTGLRNFLRPRRGVNKVYLYQDVAIFEWGHNIKRVTPEFIRAMLGVPITTFIPP